MICSKLSGCQCVTEAGVSTTEPELERPSPYLHCVGVKLDCPVHPCSSALGTVCRREICQNRSRSGLTFKATLPATIRKLESFLNTLPVTWFGVGKPTYSLCVGNKARVDLDPT